jgi:hypothetical protein
MKLQKLPVFMLILVPLVLLPIKLLNYIAQFQLKLHVVLQQKAHTTINAMGQ